MDILYLLIPLSALLVLGILGVFAWALKSGQFDDLEQQGAQILQSNDAPLDLQQGEPTARGEQSRLRPRTAMTEDP